MGARSGWFQSVLGAAEFRAPLSIPGGEVAGAEVVRELPTAFALPVWQALRCVLRWAAAAPGSRAALFEAEAMVAWEVELLEGSWDEDARLPVAVIAGALADPERADAERMARACLCVSDWALGRGAVSTGLAFAEAAALAWPEQPRYAYTAGRLLRAHGRPREAEAWMRRVVRVGRMLGDWNAQVLGLNSLGNTFTQMGDYRQAIRTLRRALRLAQRKGFDKQEGEILHDLFHATWSTGNTEAADAYAAAAFERYRHGHERLLVLVHDVAYSWAIQGYHAQAFTILRELPERFTVDNERIRALGSLARAAAGCGESEAFDRASAQVRELADAETNRDAASALVEVGIGASLLDRWEMAEAMLSQGIEIAHARSEPDVLTRAEEALEKVRERREVALRRSTADTEARTSLADLLSGFRDSLEVDTAAAS